MELICIIVYINIYMHSYLLIFLTYIYIYDKTYLYMLHFLVACTFSAREGMIDFFGSSNLDKSLEERKRYTETLLFWAGLGKEICYWRIGKRIVLVVGEIIYNLVVHI